MWFQRMAAKQKKAPTRGVEAEYSTAPETAVTHMGDENGCGVDASLLDCNSMSGEVTRSTKVLITAARRARLNSFVQAPPCQTCADL